MYEETYQGSARISQAKLALESFLRQLDPKKDRAALYAFGTELEELAPLGTEISDIHRSLASVARPRAEMAYTELYRALGETAGSFPPESRRRAVIVLSDGENFPADGSGPSAEEVILAFHRNGVTLDGISIADEKDPLLSGICESSGGVFHEVRSTAGIEAVYSEVRERITGEYLLKVKAPHFRENSEEIVLSFGELSDSRTILLPLLFGGGNPGTTLILALLAAGIAGLAALFFFPFDKPVKAAQIQTLDRNQRTILAGEATVIGSSRDAGHTIVGNPGIEAEAATILHDAEKGSYTLVGRRDLTVNNRKVRKKELSPGDVIRIEGSTIIFDAPEK